MTTQADVPLTVKRILKDQHVSIWDCLDFFIPWGFLKRLWSMAIGFQILSHKEGWGLGFFVNVACKLLLGWVVFWLMAFGVSLIRFPMFYVASWVRFIKTTGGQAETKNNIKLLAVYNIILIFGFLPMVLWIFGYYTVGDVMHWIKLD
ncbi:hypothetical protein MAFF241648_21200 [Ralstonia solanacearum]|nr:hypothetical protein MAFF241648_21200 [Ralstonia solanacearum]